MNDTAWALTWAGLLGLLTGSFLNRLIHRLPRMLQAQWEALPSAPSPAEPTYNLLVPRSHCPECLQTLKWHHQIPVLGFLHLRGRCAHCKTSISWRYPIIELVTAGLFVWVFAQHGWGFQAWVWAGFAAALVALAAIDADTRLLPDAITQPLVWSGLLAASLGLSGVLLSDALWGAAAGYLFLWSVFWLFKGLTGKDGMGQGDFKLLAALGAWLGWPALLSLVLIASLTGILAAMVLKLRGQLAQGGEMAFGPCLVLAGLWVMVWGPLPQVIF